MAGWEPTEPPELVPYVIDDKKYRQLIAELAEIFYDWFRQSENLDKASELSAEHVSQSHDQSLTTLQRGA